MQTMLWQGVVLMMIILFALVFLGILVAAQFIKETKVWTAVLGVLYVMLGGDVFCLGLFVEPGPNPWLVGAGFLAGAVFALTGVSELTGTRPPPGQIKLVVMKN